MKTFFKSYLLLTLSLLVFSLGGGPIYADSKDQSVTILFTHDLHDHFYPFTIEENGQSKTLGGFSRLSTAIEIEKEIDPNAILVDAGDFTMGTLFQTIFASHSPTLQVMGKMGYDVTTLGNHEFDFRADGLASCLQVAKDSGSPLPQIVASNTVFPDSLTPSLKALHKSMTNYGVKDYTIINRGGVKIGLFGLLGKDADSNAPMSEVTFDDIVATSKRVVKILKEEEKVDLIIALSHSGTKAKKSKSEDEILAKKVPEIDVIISGHTHSTLYEPIIIGSTVIGSAGNYGENLGVIKLAKDDKNKWKLEEYRFREVTDGLAENPEIAKITEDFKEIIQKEYLNQFNMGFDQVLAYAPFNFTPYALLAEDHSEDILGNLISDSYIAAVKKAEGEDYQEIAAAIVPSGIIRDSFVKGPITVTDVFDVSSLGLGADKISGYPLISVYVTGKELKDGAEVDASIQPLMNEAQLYMAGLNYSFNPKRMIFNKITDAYLVTPEGDREELVDDQLYRVVTGLYSAQMLSVVGDQSFGILSLIPKNKDGVPISDFEAEIIYEDGHEVKEWLALAEYLQSFDQVDGVAQVPLSYSSFQGRKTVETNAPFIQRFTNPNKITLAIYSIILLVIALISWLVSFVIKKKKTNKKTFEI